MKKCKSIKVYGETYKVYLATNEEIIKHSEEESTNRIYLGLCNRLKAIIYINQDMTLQNKKSTLFHELVHAHYYANSLMMHMIAEVSDTEEYMVRYIQTHIDELIKLKNIVDNYEDLI